MDLLKIFLVFIKSVIFSVTIYLLGFPDGSAVKESSCNVGVIGATVLIPGSGRSPGGRNGNSFQYSCLENPMERGSWWAIVNGVTESQTRLSDQCIHASSLSLSLSLSLSIFFSLSLKYKSRNVTQANMKQGKKGNTIH